MEDLQRTLAPTGISVSTTPEKGRCLNTTRNFSPGEVIITQEPYVCVPNNSSEPKCDGCFKSVNLKKCLACQVLGTVGAHVRNQSGSCIELNAKPLPDLVKKDENHSHLLYD